MADKVESKQLHWRRWIAEQERSGLWVRRFCRNQGLRESLLYWWRRRLRKQPPVRFALIDREPERREATLELVLGGGDRLRIREGVDAATLRTVLEALRG